MLKRHLIPLLVLCAIAAGCDGGTTTTTSHGSLAVRGGRVILHAEGAPEATIDQAGTLAVDGKDVAVDDHQRELLRRYYGNAAAIRQHGIETGKAGAAMAGEALKGVAESATGGGKESIDRRVEAQTQQINAQVMKICDDLAGIRAVQDELAASLPAFRPYAGIMDAKEVEDCRKDAKN